VPFGLTVLLNTCFYVLFYLYRLYLCSQINDDDDDDDECVPLSMIRMCRNEL